MENKEFRILRKKLEKTQKQMSELLGASLRAVQSFEQGWRKVPGHVERQLLFLYSMKKGKKKKVRACWDIRKCSPLLRKICPAFEFNSGNLCEGSQET